MCDFSAKALSPVVQMQAVPEKAQGEDSNADQKRVIIYAKSNLSFMIA